jgi:hypothetical protein
MHLRNSFYYAIKPLIPRPIQILLRRRLAVNKRKKYSAIWPIDEKAAMPPTDWKGWPGGKQFALVLQHDVDTQKGHDKCCDLMDLEEKLGVRSCFNIVPERYTVSQELLNEIKQRGFGIGVHGLKHDGKLFINYIDFLKKAERVNGYLHKWNTHGFSSPSMISRLEWMHHLDIDFSTSSFDTDPFEPQPVAVSTIFPFIVWDKSHEKRFVELPYTLPQDFTLFIILKERSIDIWKKKLDWIAQHGGMALVNVHPDYLNFQNNKKCPREEYPACFYIDFIDYIQKTHLDRFWNARPDELARHITSKRKDAV